MENEPGLGKYVFSAKACSAIHQRAKAKGLALLLVPGENLRLGLGPAVCMAGLGRATHLRRTHPSRRPVLPARAGRDGVPRSRVWTVGRPDRDLLVERRATEVAVGCGKTTGLALFFPDPSVRSPVNIPDGAGFRFLAYVCRGGPTRWSPRTRTF